ncbi:HAMP domain-containing sensor histidine kinase [Nonomuraea sp. NPDC049784]|uniref:sensor histidine kinase n=1 Tax=Nonomuraea sp. NPDC049784 TaxID=3154361 RepID=UPI0033CC7DAD
MAANATHELLTPLTGVRANLEEAHMHPEDAPVAVHNALYTLRRLEAIVADLIVLTLIPGRPDGVNQSMDLACLVAADVARRQSSRIRPPCHIQMELTKGAIVDGSFSLLTRIVTTLIDHAAAFAATRVSVAVLRHGRSVMLSVSNDGDVIREDDRERIFEPFHQRDTDRRTTYGATGVGLTVAREITEAYGGNIRVENVHPGVRFLVRLPFSSSEAAEEESSEGRRPVHSPA